MVDGDGDNKSWKTCTTRRRTIRNRREVGQGEYNTKHRNQKKKRRKSKSERERKQNINCAQVLNHGWLSISFADARFLESTASIGSMKLANN